MSILHVELSTVTLLNSFSHFSSQNTLNFINTFSCHNQTNRVFSFMNCPTFPFSSCTMTKAVTALNDSVDPWPLPGQTVSKCLLMLCFIRLGFKRGSRRIRGVSLTACITDETEHSRHNSLPLWHHHRAPHERTPANADAKRDGWKRGGGLSDRGEKDVQCGKNFLNKEKMDDVIRESDKEEYEAEHI